MGQFWVGFCVGAGGTILAAVAIVAGLLMSDGESTGGHNFKR